MLVIIEFNLAVVLEGFEGIWEAEWVVFILLGEAHGAICKCGGL